MPPVTTTSSSTQRRGKGAVLANAAEVGGIRRQIAQTFAAYQVARANFTNALQAFLIHDQNSTGVALEALVKADVLAVLCCPLVHDPSPGVHGTALDCLGRLAGADTLLSDALLSSGVLDNVLASLGPANAPTIQTAANGVVQALAKSSRENAAAVVEAGAMEHLLAELEAGTPAVKEAAVHSLSTLVQSQCSSGLTESLCNNSTLSLLVAVVNAPGCSPGLQHAIISTMGHMCSTGPQAASAVVAAGALSMVAAVAKGQAKPELRAAAFTTMSHVARHSTALAEAVAMAGALGPALQALTEACSAPLRAGSASLLLEVSRKTPELSERVVSEQGAAGCLMSYLQLEAGKSGCLAGLMIAGSLASFRAATAQNLLDASVGRELISNVSSADPLIAGTAAWALEQCGRHNEALATAVAQGGALLPLTAAYERLEAFKEQQHRAKVKSAIKTIVRGCADAGPLEALVSNATAPELLKHVLMKLQKVLGSCASARQHCVTSGAMVRLQALGQRMRVGAGTALAARVMELIEGINALFPADVVAWAT